MSGVLKFITITQKILIIICILCFIPTSVFIFLAKSHTFSEQHVRIYELAYRQVYQSFVVGLREDCSFREAVLNGSYCFSRAGFQVFQVRLVGETGTCVTQAYEYDGLSFCSGDGTPILNNLTNTSPPTFTHSNSLYPIYTLSPTPSATTPTPTYYHYLSSKKQSCQPLATSLTNHIQQKYSLYYYKSYQDSSRLLWLYSMPILALLVGLIGVNQISGKYNLRKYIVMAAISVNAVLIALIIKTIVHFSDVENFQQKILEFSDCFVKEERTSIAEMANFDSGIGFGLVFFMGIVLLLIFLSMVGLLVAKLLEMKYYSSREQPQLSGVELSDLKTSLRSRQIKQSTSSQSKTKKILLQSQE